MFNKRVLYGFLSDALAEWILTDRTKLLDEYGHCREEPFGHWLGLNYAGGIWEGVTVTDVIWSMGTGYGEKCPAVLIHTDTLEQIHTDAELRALPREPFPELEWCPAPLTGRVRNGGGVQAVSSAVLREDVLGAPDLLARVGSGRYKSVSFDLHGTLVTARQGWEARIYLAFKEVMEAAGHGAFFAKLERKRGGFDAAVARVVEVSKSCYRLHDLQLDAAIASGVHGNPAERWCHANTSVIKEILRKCWSDPELEELGRQVHERISGSPPELWVLSERERAIVAAARQHASALVLSNGSRRAVEACVAMHLPELVPSWHVLTPELFLGFGKPSPMNAVLLLYGASAALVRDALDEKLHRRWTIFYMRYMDRLTDEVLEKPTQPLRPLARAIRDLCARVRVEPCDDYLVLPEQHLHVGNSRYHDCLPAVEGHGFDCVLYLAEGETS